MTTSRLLVIGAGPVGLAIANALRQAGIAYDQVEADANGIGGIWRHGIYPGLHMLSSKGATAFRDFPMPDDYPDFPSGKQVLAYLESYARTRGLMASITLGRSVTTSRQNADDSWTVGFADGEVRTYKGLVVCVGHHWDPVLPELAGTFSGRLMHAKDYRGVPDLAGKRVLVVGGGNSGCDIVSEAARVARSADWCLRRGVWLLPKTVLGIPIGELPIWRWPVFVQRMVMRAALRAIVGDYRRYGLPVPEHDIFARHQSITTEPLGYLQQGRIRVRPAIAELDGERVRFADGSDGHYDVIVAATGYRLSFPFLPPRTIEVIDETAQLLGGGFPVGIRNLYVIGTEQPRIGFGYLLTPAAALFARMIAMQDELEHPIGTLLKFTGHDMPESPFMDPGEALREIRWGGRLLWVLRIQDRRLSRRERRRADVLGPVASPIRKPQTD